MVHLRWNISGAREFDIADVSTKPAAIQLQTHCRCLGLAASYRHVVFLYCDFSRSNWCFNFAKIHLLHIPIDVTLIRSTNRAIYYRGSAYGESSIFSGRFCSILL